MRVYDVRTLLIFKFGHHVKRRLLSSSTERDVKL